MAKTKRVKSRKRPQGRPRPPGWLTTDADEIERRRQRGLDEAFHIEPLTSDDPFYGVYRVRSDNGQAYRVEIRSLAEAINTCDCPDHRINGLGTCKHVEATLHRLKKGRVRAFGAAAFKGCPTIEIFQDRRDSGIRVRWSAGAQRRSRLRDLLAPFFGDDNTLVGDPLDTLPALQRAIDAAPAAVRGRIRASRELNAWLETMDRREQQVRARRHFETEVAAGNASLDLVKVPLYPYQQAGMLHLAFTGRALLADEMGLGKTVQGVAACELLRRTMGIRRVLVVCPASLKGEWEEQIAKFTDLDSRIIQGSRAQRLRQYGEPAFFTLANYEQVRPDAEEINTILAPDVIILDEAQRIKNWQTRTASSIKRLKSPYAFVLTGTPLENRIDEIYSIVQFLDPSIFGPLFRFNRDFYELDERGRAIGYKNLDRLHERLRPVMLRRRKGDVEGQLPGRTVNTYFVPMHKEQSLRYEEYETKAARLAAMARHRPLKKEEMEQLQRNLACMRMICDTPYILDQECRIAPKLKELDNILKEIMEDREHKIIVFSEWERMLRLLREQLGDSGLEPAWHTGKVPQAKRRAEIRRFREDPECRMFLSTDSGALGLNLQVADVVINLDLPWNPARLEQRIARAWRKHQKRPVQVINLVTEDSIEHRMMSLLEQKRSLAEGVVDGKGGKEMSLPSGRAAFLERVGSLFAEEPRPVRAKAADPFQQVVEEIESRSKEHLDLIELHGEGDDRTLVVVSDRVDDALRDALARRLESLFPEKAPRLTLLDRATQASIQELIAAGVLQSAPDPARTLYRAETTPDDGGQARRLAEALDHIARGRHKQRMAAVLNDGGFPGEALAPMREAVDIALQALVIWRGHDAGEPPSLGLIDSSLVHEDLLAPADITLIARMREESSGQDEVRSREMLAQGRALFARAVSQLESAK
ncbi:MAG: DEAD/DEAH box helicase [Gammaproteobacteria bacterium]|nr:DEAD/DEAH box helicase [Gammaproteobacteria bacterium]